MVRRGRFSSQDGAPDYQKGLIRSIEMYTESRLKRSIFKQNSISTNPLSTSMLEFNTV